MRSARLLLLGASLVPAAFAASAQVNLSPVPRPEVQQQSMTFAWSGSLEGAAAALGARLGYAKWASMASGLAVPRPPPVVDVSISVDGGSAADIVMQMNRQAPNRAVVVLDPERRFIQVVYYG